MKFLMILVSMLLNIVSHAQNNTVVIELFTSQGCSSCPAADKNLSSILQEAEHEGKLIYGLSFHVDYWNNIGWKDPYSSKAFTNRQRNYVTVLGLASMYTPQMIVNGRDEFVGSDEMKSSQSIQAALKQQSAFSITINNLTITDNKVQFQYSLDKQPKQLAINVALVEKSLENYVASGENRGRKLHHDNVVREFISLSAKQNDHIEIVLPQQDKGKYSLIVFVQDQDMKILGASRITMP